MIERFIRHLDPRHLRLAAWTLALATPLVFGWILHTFQANAPADQRGGFAYADRITLWSWVSYSAHHGAPLLSGREKVSGPLRPIEMVYSDDMGFSLLVAFTTRMCGRALGRADFFAIVIALNVLLLWLFLGTFTRSAVAMIVAAILVLAPSFYIPRAVIGPDLFTLYGTLALSAVSVVLLAIHGKSPLAWVGAGFLAGSIYFLRQAIGLMIFLVVAANLVLYLGNRLHRSMKEIRRWYCLVGGVCAVWLLFHGLLLWRDSRLGLKPGENRMTKHHTVFHPLYLGIGNIPDNPWGIVYADGYAYHQLRGPDSGRILAHDQDYLDDVRERYLSLWKTDGWLLIRCYTRQFFSVVGSTLGYGTFLLVFAWAGWVGFSRLRSPHPPSILETAILALAATLAAFLLQSTLVDPQLIFSYPTGLLGRYLLGFVAADALRRFILHRQEYHGSPPMADRCPLCDSRALHLSFRKHGIPYTRCRECRFLFAECGENPNFPASLDRLEDAYRQYFDDKPSSRIC